jgi:CubicO group peptidase (beta-lactamase class C family)
VVFVTAIVSSLSLSTSRTLDRALEGILNDPVRPISSLSVAAIKKGSVVYARAFGSRWIDPEDPRKDKPATVDTRYRVASISKLVTALGVMKLVELGQLELDRDVSEYLGWTLRNPNFPDAPITTRMLLSHTASLRDENGYVFGPDVRLEDVLTPDGAEFGPQSWSEQAPGFFTYTNLNFGVIATVMERISGTRFDHFMDQHVLAPLGIGGGYNPASFSNSKLKTLATLYRKLVNNQWSLKYPWVPQVDDYSSQSPEDPGAEYEIGTNGTIFSPQGGLRLSTLELARVALMLMNDGLSDGQPFLMPQTVQTMLSDQWTFKADNGDPFSGLFRSWGLSVQRFTDTTDDHGSDRIIEQGGLKWFGHLGEAYGLLSGLLFDPVTKNGMIYVIGGVGANPEQDPGAYSSFFRREELILNALFENAIKAF